MKAKKILVTGGAGFIGTHAVVELVKAGYDPIILDNFCNSKHFIIGRLEKIIGRRVVVYKEDCSDRVRVDKIFKETDGFSGIIHFAALKAVGESIDQPLRYFRNNVDGMLTILEAAVRYKTPHIILSSSCTVYGQPDKLPVRETSPQKDSQCPYGDTKKISERMLSALVESQAKVKGVSLRYFNPIGAHPSGLIGELPLGVPKNLVPFVTQTAAGIRRELVINGDNYQTPDGTCIRDYIHVMDLARGHVQALKFLENQRARTFYDVFNLGTGHGDSVLGVIKAFEKATDTKVNYRVGPRRPGDIEKIYANVAKAKKVLNWEARFSLEEALRHAWAWQKQIPSGA